MTTTNQTAFAPYHYDEGMHMEDIRITQERSLDLFAKDGRPFQFGDPMFRGDQCSEFYQGMLAVAMLVKMLFEQRIPLVGIREILEGVSMNASHFALTRPVMALEAVKTRPQGDTTIGIKIDREGSNGGRTTVTRLDPSDRPSESHLDEVQQGLKLMMAFGSILQESKKTTDALNPKVDDSESVLNSLRAQAEVAQKAFAVVELLQQEYRAKKEARKASPDATEAEQVATAPPSAPVPEEASAGAGTGSQTAF